MQPTDWRQTRRERERGLHVHDVAAAHHRPRLVEGDDAGLDVLVGIERGLVVGRVQARQPEEHHLLVAVARRGQERTQALHRRRDETDFLVALANRRDLRCLAGIQRARRKLPQFAVDGDSGTA